MGLIEIASGNSVWRGMDYYEKQKVISWNKFGDVSLSRLKNGNKRKKKGNANII